MYVMDIYSNFWYIYIFSSHYELKLTHVFTIDTFNNCGYFNLTRVCGRTNIRGSCSGPSSLKDPNVSVGPFWWSRRLSPLQEVHASVE